jgi:hypothetical protein
LVAFGATIPDAMAGADIWFAAAILSAYSYSDRLHRPGRRESRRALKVKRHLPDFADLLPEIAIL